MTDALPQEERKAHEGFAKQLHGRTWLLIEKPDRDPLETETMIHAAHASCYHWLQAGTAVHHQRGIWLIARAYTVAGRAAQAMFYARRCQELTQEHKEGLEDFDFAFADECMARASALAGNKIEALKLIEMARVRGEEIAKPEDREIFLKELEGGEWYGIL
jgi:hypothetical protein